MSTTNGNGHRPDNPLNGERPHGRPQCEGRSKQSGNRCKNAPTPGRRFCKFHGGKTPTGLAAPAYKHGRYSRYMPTGLLDDYKRILDDPTLSQHRESLALIDVMIEGKLKAAFDVDVTETLKTIDDQLDRFLKVREAQAKDPWAGLDPEKHLAAAIEAVKAGVRSSLEFEAVQPLLEQRRKTAESENKRTAALANSLSPEQARMFVLALGDAIKRHVPDLSTQRAIFDDFSRIIGR